MVSFKKIAVILFGRLADKYYDKFAPLRKSLDEANMKILLRTYICIIFLLMLITPFIVFPIIYFLTIFLEIILVSQVRIFLSVLGAIGATGLVFTIAYFFPNERANSRKRSLNSNLPFAVNHMAAIASSGVPPKIVFKLLAEFGEYGEVSKEAMKIIRNVEVFGQDITTAIEESAAKIPSQDFKEILYGILATIRTGGNLRNYLQVQAREALFIYRLRREEYLQALSTYADFYTAVMIAAPLFLISILAIMNIIGGTIRGMTIEELMNLGIYLGIPAMNIGFILFIHLTQPETI